MTFPEELVEERVALFLKNLSPTEELIAKTIIITKYLFGKGYRAEGEGDQESANSLKEVARGMRGVTQKYAEEMRVSEARVRKLERTIYDIETTM